MKHSRVSAGAHGLTIIELITVLIVVGVLISLAAPSFRGMIQRQRVQGVSDQVLGDLQLARSEVAGRGGAAVAVSFGGNGALSCYTIHSPASAPGAACDCTRTPGQACVPAGALQEIKTAQVPRAEGVSVAASSPGGPMLNFAPPQGVATPGFVVTVQGDAGGQLRTDVRALGSLSVCSPDGSMRGVPTCP